MNKKLLFVLILVLCVSLLCACKPTDDNPPEPTPDEVTIVLSKQQLDLEMGQSATITATVGGSDEVPTWTTSAPDVATVSGGKVTALADGTATITATIGDVAATCVVTVNSHETVTFDRTLLKLFKGESVKVGATVKKGLVEQQVAVTYSAQPEGYVTVDDDGIVTGVKITKSPVTEVLLTATTANGATATCVVTVEEVVVINLSQTEVTLHPNGQNTARIEVSGKKGQYALNAASVDWTSSNPDIVEVKVDSKGATLTAKRSGNVTITASVAGSSEVAVCNVESWYALSTPEDMEYMRTDINGVFKLVNDIDFGGKTWDGVTKWKGDGIPDSEYFGGILDGQGYAIKNINILSGWNNAIIGQTNTTSVVRNLSVVNLVNQDTSNKVGSIVSFNKGLIENCYLENTIQSDSQSNWNSHGGIVATNAQTGIIRNCIVRVTASRAYNNAGAIVGYNCGVLDNCYAICTEAVLPLYVEWSTSLGTITDCGVYTSVGDFVSGAQLHTFSDKVWTNTGLDVPSLYHYQNVSFDKDTLYFAQGRRYNLNPANVTGAEMQWQLVDNDGALVCEQNADYSLNFFARKKGVAKLTVKLVNGATASVNIVVTGVVISPDVENVSLDYNNPSLSDNKTIRLFDEQGNEITQHLTFTTTDERIATVDENGVITAVGAGKCFINVSYLDDNYMQFVAVDVTGWQQISTPQQLQAMKDNYKLNYCLVNDIDFGNNEFITITKWTATDSDELYFSGIFDGNGFSVKNVKVVGNDSGIWGRTATTAVIRNTVFDNIEFAPSGNNTVANTFGVVAFNTGTVRDCIVKAKFNVGHTTDYRTGGGICGNNEFRGRVYNCISYVDASAVKGAENYVGVLFGLCQGVARDCIGIVVGNTTATVNAISFINSSGVSACKHFATEQAAVAEYAPFGSFSTAVWNVSDTSLPTLRHLF